MPVTTSDCDKLWQNRFERDAGVLHNKTNTIFRTGKDGLSKDYYTLDCILFLLKNINLAHAMYVRQAAVSA